MQIVSEKYSEQASVEELRNERLFESVQDVIRFEQLLDTAERLCLREAPQYGDYLPPVDNEAKLISQVGTLGVRYALERIGGIDNGFEPFDDSLPHPLREPEQYAGPFNRRLLAKAATFGDALIRESYTILGSDADAWVEEYKVAENDEAQIAVLEKLNQRLDELANSDRGLEDGGNGDYQSIRLSPKAIGEYPDFNLPPTCLGIAAIGAGFLKKAEATFLHAGVMETAYQTSQMELSTVIAHTIKPETQKDIGIYLPDDIVARLQKKEYELLDAASADIGTHSALFVRLSSGRWYQLDPVLGVSTETVQTRSEDGSLESRDDLAIDAAYKNLTDHQEIAPGLELSVNLPVFTFNQSWLDYLYGLGQMDDSVVEELLIENEGPVTEGLRRYVVDEWLLKETTDFYSIVIRDEYLQYLRFSAEGDEEEERVVDVVARDAIKDFVLQDVSEEEWAERCRTDTEFRQRAIQEIKRLPALMGVLFGLEVVGSSSVPIHTKVEFGLPEASIGLAALHNIGLDLDSDLSAHHWLSQWPSHVVPHDMLYKMSQLPIQEQVVRRHIERLTQKGALAFIHTYVTMIESQEDNAPDLASVEEQGVSDDSQDHGCSSTEAQGASLRGWDA